MPEASLCGVGTTVAVAAPDGTADAAAHVTLFRYGTIINAHNDVAVPSAWRRSQMSFAPCLPCRNSSGFLFIGVMMSCDWLMVVDSGSGQGVAGSVAYGSTLLEFQQQFSSDDISSYISGTGGPRPLQRYGWRIPRSTLIPHNKRMHRHHVFL